MGKVRLLIEGSLSDYETFSSVVKRAVAMVESEEPGVLVYECFAADDNTRAVFHEIYADADALLGHFGRMQETGMMGELLAVCQIDNVRVLNRVEDERARELLSQFGGVHYHGMGGVVR